MVRMGKTCEPKAFSFQCMTKFTTKKKKKKESTCQCRRCKRSGFNPWVGKILWSRKWHPPPVFLPGEFHGQRRLVGYSPWGCKELDMIEQLNTSHCKDF